MGRNAFHIFKAQKYVQIGKMILLKPAIHVSNPSISPFESKTTVFL